MRIEIMRGVYCIKDFCEDDYEYWSKGCFYAVIRRVDDGYEIEHNFGGVGLIYDEDFDEYFVWA